MDEILEGGSVCAPDVEKEEPYVLSVRGLRACYGERQVLDIDRLDVRDRTITAVIGPSGCGKSTLLSCLNRTIELIDGARWEGYAALSGNPISKMSAEEVRGRIGMVMQKPAPLPFSVERNITYALRYRGMRRRDELAGVVREQLERVGLLDELGGDVRRSALALSGGQQQRLCIARALAVNPRVLLLDEPCSALDVASTKVVEGVLTEVARTCAVVVVTHNLAQARRIADEIICLDAGRMAWSGKASELFEQRREDVLAPLYGGDLL